jgi:hypothetical protein
MTMSNQHTEPSTGLTMGIDPWGKGLLGTSEPGRTFHKEVFLGTFGIFVSVDTFDVEYYIRLPEAGVMELHDVDPWGRGKLRARRPLDPSLPGCEQYKQLILEIFIAGHMYQGPVCLSEEGLFKQRDWRDLEARLKAAMRPRDRSEFNDCFDLLKLMDQLGQEVVHHGGDSEYFMTKCPAHRMHRIDLRPRTGEWYCGYCAQGGGVEDLKKHWEKHRP